MKLGIHITPSTLIIVEAALNLEPVIVSVVPPFDGPYLGETVDTTGVSSYE